MKIKRWIAAAVAALLLGGCGGQTVPTAAPETGTPATTETPTKTELTLAWAGDLVCHDDLNTEAFNGTDYDYTAIMSGSANYIAGADYAFCCMETTLPDTTVYTGYPVFRSPVGLARSMKAIGFDLVNTCNNHSVDSQKQGLIETLDTLDAVGLDHVGTYRTEDERDADHGVLVKVINGVSIAFLSYTYGTNAISIAGYEYAVNVFYSDYLSNNYHLIDYDMLDADMAYARSLNTDFIAVFMHWGNEYYREPFPDQVELADYLFRQGADLVLGGHTHVPEPMEVRRVTDLDGNEKTGYLCYCLSNYISCQNDRYTNLTAVVLLTLEKDWETGAAYLKNVCYVPMFMVDLQDYGITSTWRYRLWDLHAAISDYENGNDRGVITPTLYEALRRGLEDLYSVFDAKFDKFAPSYHENTAGEYPV